MGWDWIHIGKGMGKEGYWYCYWLNCMNAKIQPKEGKKVCSIETCSESIQQTIVYGMLIPDSWIPAIRIPHGDWYPVLELSRITDGLSVSSPLVENRRGGFLFLGVTFQGDGNHIPAHDSFTRRCDTYSPELENPNLESHGHANPVPNHQFRFPHSFAGHIHDR